MNNIPVLNAADVERRLSPAVCNRLMEEVFRQEESGACTQYLRTAIRMPDENIMAAMPAYFHAGYFGMKVLSVYPRNSRDGYPSHQGGILVFDEEHGELKGIVDAMAVTRIRTGSCSAVATRALANPQARKLALIGCGQQAHSHLLAMRELFKLDHVSVYDIDEKRADRFAQQAEAEVSIAVTVCPTVQKCVEDADIICTLTPGTPAGYLKAEWIKEGAHINAVGACVPTLRELESGLVRRARFYCDHVESVMHESGDFLLAMKEGGVSPDHLIGTVGQVLNGHLAGRQDAAEITVFESLGMAVEDLIVAHYVLGREE